MKQIKNNLMPKFKEQEMEDGWTDEMETCEFCSIINSILSQSCRNFEKEIIRLSEARVQSQMNSWNQTMECLDMIIQDCSRLKNRINELFKNNA